MNLRNMITIYELRKYPIFKEWSALHGNFQGVTFDVESQVLPSLHRLLVKHNPEAASILEGLP